MARTSKLVLVDQSRAGGVVSDGKERIKLTASATRVFLTLAESKRSAATRSAAEFAAADERATHGRVWDGHFALATGYTQEIRPGVAADEDVVGFLKELGLRRAAVTSPKPRS